eukprot:TRINITY_DN62601_c0_g1_i1.p1 TRINITY_DN62601_c0_g1~~TRINITY_DN62601_c0_g1_i1.p1  ORF type:complete len:256 (+),score=13.90 TRINITY_DN62601_c0_g1_i1:105-872(+)
MPTSRRLPLSLAIVGLLLAIRQASAKCESNHEPSACLIDGQPDSSCCVDTSRTQDYGCKGDYELRTPDRGCGGQTYHLIVAVHEFPNNYYMCCTKPDPTGLILAICGVVLFVCSIGGCIFACVKCGCCNSDQPVPLQVQTAQVVTVQVPPGAGPGTVLSVATPYGGSMQVTIPYGYGPGTAFQVQCPPPQQQIMVQQVMVAQPVQVQPVQAQPIQAQPVQAQPIQGQAVTVQGQTAPNIVQAQAVGVVVEGNACS